MKKIAFLLVAIATLTCEQPIEFAQNSSVLLVVDGKVSTETRASYIQIYQITSGDQSQKEYLSGFAVSVKSIDGDEILFSPTENSGIYRPDESFRAVVGQKYMLQAIGPSGQELSSSFDAVMEPVDFLLEIVDTSEFVAEGSANIVVEREAKAAVANLNIANKTAYQAKFTFEMKYVQVFTGEILSEEKIDSFVLFDCKDRAACATSGGVKVSVGLAQHRDWTFINPACDEPPPSCVLPCCEHFQSYQTEFIVRQEAQSEETYAFWEEVEKLLKNDGLVFDTFPFPVNGNIECENCEYPVVGYFSTVSVNEQKSMVVL